MAAPVTTGSNNSSNVSRARTGPNNSSLTDNRTIAQRPGRAPTATAPGGGAPRRAADFRVGMKVVHDYRGDGVVEEAPAGAGVVGLVRVRFHSGDAHSYGESSLNDGKLQPAAGAAAGPPRAASVRGAVAAQRLPSNLSQGTQGTEEDARGRSESLFTHGAVLQKGGGGWQDDKARPECSTCQKPFNLTRRRHHCRACGDVFCDDCSKGREDLEDEKGKVRKDQRLCGLCYTSIQLDKSTALWAAVQRPRYYYALKRLELDDKALRRMGDGELAATLRSAGVPDDEVGDVAARVRDLTLSGPGGAAPAFASRSPGDTSGARSSSASLKSPLRRAVDSRLSGAASGSASRVSALSPSPVERMMKGRAQEEAMRREIEQLQAQVADADGRRRELQKQRSQAERRLAEFRRRRGDVVALRRREARRRDDDEQWAAGDADAAAERRGAEEQRHAAFAAGSHHEKACWSCGEAYTATRREHHCRTTWHSVCAACSEARLAGGERVCDWALALTLLRDGGALRRHAVADVAARRRWAALCDAAAAELAPRPAADDDGERDGTGAANETAAAAAPALGRPLPPRTRRRARQVGPDDEAPEVDDPADREDPLAQLLADAED